MKARILLVEDNPLTAKGLTYLFEHEDYQVTVAPDLVTARAQVDTNSFDLILLDVTLPDGRGFQLARQLRETMSEIPIIFLTACDDEADIVVGFELGAEDYITKPFRNRELLLRVQKALRRGRPETDNLNVGAISLDLASGETFVHECPVNLTALERKILACLLASPDRVVTRERLLDEIWSASGSVVNDNTLSVYLKRLRQKLNSPGVIETVKNVGYRLRSDHAT